MIYNFLMRLWQVWLFCTDIFVTLADYMSEKYGEFWKASLSFFLHVLFFTPSSISCPTRILNPTFLVNNSREKPRKVEAISAFLCKPDSLKFFLFFVFGMCVANMLSCSSGISSCGVISNEE